MFMYLLLAAAAYDFADNNYCLVHCVYVYIFYNYLGSYVLEQVLEIKTHAAQVHVAVGKKDATVDWVRQSW